MREYLVLQLYGPLASWGDIAVGETRPSALTPAKSTVLGLVAAALGFKRPDPAMEEAERNQWENQHNALAKGYGMAVKVHALGVPLSDYHTAQVPSSGTGRNRKTFHTRHDEITWHSRSELNTILSRRDYRQDAYCRVALWARDDALIALTWLREVLLAPHFTLYLGRKACPLALPLDPQIISANSMEEALSQYNSRKLFKLLLLVWGKSAKSILKKVVDPSTLLLWDHDAETIMSPQQTITRRDEPLSRRRWQFSVREEHSTHIKREGT